MARHENWLPLQPDLNPSDLGLSDQRRGGQWFGTLSTHGLSDKIQHDPRSRGGETGTPGDSLRLGGAKRPEDDNERKRSRKKEQERLLAMSESSAAMLARVLHKKGGCILVVGGGISNIHLPDHPQILVWDDVKVDCLHKEVPTNTRAILWTKHIGHSMAARLNNAAEKFHILKFPMLKTQDLRYLLSEIKPYEEMERITEPDPIPKSKSLFDEGAIFGGVPQLMENRPNENPVEIVEAETSAELEPNEMSLRKPERGEVPKILAEILTTKEGSITEEAERVTPILKSKYGLKMSPAAIYSAVLSAMNRRGTKTGELAHARRKVELPVEAEPKPGATEDSFTEAEKMLKDAQAAITLLQEFIPKLRKETANLRKREAKIKALFSED